VPGWTGGCTEAAVTSWAGAGYANAVPVPTGTRGEVARRCAPRPDVPATSGNAIRDATVAAASSKIGSVYSDAPSVADETGDKMRTGWETLTEIFSVALPTFTKRSRES